MATKQAKAQRTATADSEIKAHIRAIGDLLSVDNPPEPQPIEYRGDPEMYPLIEKERLSEWLGQVVTVLAAQTHDVPEHYLRAEQLARDGANKADIVAALLNEDADGDDDE